MHFEKKYLHENIPNDLLITFGIKKSLKNT